MITKLIITTNILSLIAGILIGTGISVRKLPKRDARGRFVSKTKKEDFPLIKY